MSKNEKKQESIFKRIKHAWKMMSSDTYRRTQLLEKNTDKINEVKKHLAEKVNNEGEINQDKANELINKLRNNKSRAANLNVPSRKVRKEYKEILKEVKAFSKEYKKDNNGRQVTNEPNVGGSNQSLNRTHSINHP